MWYNYPMKILKQERQKNTATLEIEVPYSEFKSANDQALEKAAKQLKLPGFRPGKAPKAMVEKALDPRAIEDRAAQEVITSLYPQILKEAKLDPVDYPQLEVVTLEANKPFVFKLTIEVYPDIKLGKYKGLSAKKKSAEVTEDEILKALGNLQNRLARRIEVKDRPAQKEDWVDFEIEAQAEGAPIKRWPRKMQFYPVGMGMIYPAFDEQLIGMNPGESKEFKISFAAGYMVPEIAGKEVTFKVKIEKVQEKELMPLDDEFAKKVSRFGTLGELKAEIKRSLEAEKKEESEADLRNKIIEEIVKGVELDLPQAMIHAETGVMLDELEASLAHSNLKLEDYLKSIQKNEESLRKELKAPAETRAKSKVALKKISEIEGLTATPTEIEKEIEALAKVSRRKLDEYKSSLGEGGNRYIADYLSRRNALEFVIKEAKIEEGGKI